MGAKLTKEDIKELTSSSSFDAKEIKEVHKIFVELDADKSGELDRQEFGKLSKHIALFKNSSEAQLGRLFDAFDTEHNGSVSFKEFVVALSILSKGNPDAKLAYLFDIFDSDHSGTLEKAELQKILEHMLQIAQAIGRGNAKTANFVENMLKKLEIEKYNGHVPKDKWVQVGCQTPSLLLFLGAIDESQV